MSSSSSSSKRLATDAVVNEHGDDESNDALTHRKKRSSSNGNGNGNDAHNGAAHDEHDEESVEQDGVDSEEMCFIHAHRGTSESQLLESLSLHDSIVGKALPNIGTAPAHLWVYVLTHALALELQEVRNFYWLVKQSVIHSKTPSRFEIFDEHVTSRELLLSECTVVRFAQVCHAARLLVASDFCQTELAQIVDQYVAEVELIPSAQRMPSNLLRFYLCPYPSLSLHDALLLNERRFLLVRFAVNCVMAHTWSARVANAELTSLLLEGRSDAAERAAVLQQLQLMCVGSQWFQTMALNRAQRTVVWYSAPFGVRRVLVDSDSVLPVPIHRPRTHNELWPKNAHLVCHNFHVQLRAYRLQVREQNAQMQLIRAQMGLPFEAGANQAPPDEDADAEHDLINDADADTDDDDGGGGGGGDDDAIVIVDDSDGVGVDIDVDGND
jgi:hypothetical protein